MVGRIRRASGPARYRLLHRYTLLLGLFWETNRGRTNKLSTGCFSIHQGYFLLTVCQYTFSKPTKYFLLLNSDIVSSTLNEIINKLKEKGTLKPTSSLKNSVHFLKKIFMKNLRGFFFFCCLFGELIFMRVFRLFKGKGRC